MIRVGPIRVDEIADLADKAVAAQAYFRQSQDVENEMQASRIRVRAERKLGEILKRMAANGERSTGGKPSRDARVTTLKDLQIPPDRASRAMQLADVPQEQFDAALAEPERARFCATWLSEASVIRDMVTANRGRKMRLRNYQPSV